jgi:predicted metal-dependent hydrolase
MISFSRRSASYRVRLHKMFLNADEEVIAALGSYIRGEDRSASGLLDRFIHENRRQIRRVSPALRQSRLPLRASGEHHDLQYLLNQVTEESFGELANDVAIAWAPAPPVRLPRRSIKLGSYSADTQIIRIHPALDQAFVPEFFIRWIIHHELLHHVFREDLKARNGRVHTPEFCALERQFPDYREALFWERRNLDLLLWWERPQRALRPTGT